jgi:TfoX/Sxy family transcriptional regulator of competence genes
MPYNLELEKRIDQFTDRLGKFSKKKMFGGIGYLINGNMAFGIHKQSLVIRVDPEQTPQLLDQDGWRPFDITGRPMKGWLLVSPEVLPTEKQLADILNLCLDYVNTLPKK